MEEEVATDRYGDKFSADTIEELARKAGIDAEVLKKSVEDYNHYCDIQNDEEYGKPAEYLQKITEPPFYLLHQAVMFLCMLGGIEVNTDMQVVDGKLDPIAGLYAIGADSCQLYLTRYTLFFAGSAYASNIHSGRRAAQHIAATLL